MRKTKSNLFFIFTLAFAFIILNQVACTHDDQSLDEFIPTGPVQDFSNSDLEVKKVSVGPIIDGQIDAAWDDALKLNSEASVPDPGEDLFKGYVGDTYDFTMRGMYDDNNIYILAEWSDNTMDLNRQTWFFNPITKTWAQESRYPTFNSSGVMTRMPFYEDKFAVLWNVDNSVANWDATTCFVTCHTGLGADKGIARHYTNAPGETIDMWHWKSVRNGVANGQMDDQYQDEAQPNGRHSDNKVTGGYTNNVQEIDVNGTIVKVPLYLIPGRNYYNWITKEEIDNETAILITNTDENGILYYEGGSIDPSTDLEYQRDGDIVGPKGIPSVYIEPWTGSRGDLKVSANYTGSGWVMEIQRALSTGDTDGQDVDFSSLQDQSFGIGIFDNAALAHAIKSNLILKFE